jgi:capsular exopolysaccharide synthesis family protein
LEALRQQTVAEMGLLPETEAEESRLVLQVETIRRMADLLREEHQRARIAEAVEEGEVHIIDLARLPREPVGARRSLKLLVGLMLGLLLGGGVAFLRENLDTAIRRGEDLEDVLHVPGLGVVPRIGAGRPRTSWTALPRLQVDRLRSAPSLKALLSRALPRVPQNGGNGKNGENATTAPKSRRITPVADGRSAAAEAYRSVRTGLLFSEALHSLRTLLITSPSPAEGKTTTAANLAITFAEQGKRVLLVDADLRRPRLHDVFGISRDPGLTQLILGQASLSRIVHQTQYGLHVLPAGLLPPNPAELLGGERMQEVIDELRTAYEFVIFDAAPVLVAADPVVLATRVDGSLLVVRAGKTGREDGIQALHRLASVDARVVGGVLNDPDGSLAHLGGYYRYAYNYQGYYSDD